jgi:hypothetical protein
VTRRGSDAEVVDEGFWGGPRRLSPLTGSYLVDALVGSIGLIASMPITTALAALLAPRMSDKQLAGAEHAHAH